MSQDKDSKTLPLLDTQGLTAEDIIRAGIRAAGGEVSMASSFSVEDVVVIDMLHKIAPQVRVFAIDTGRLNEETYQVAESVRARYDLRIDWYFPERQTVENLEREKGLFSFRESLDNRHECCRIRKVEPLGRALDGLSGWVVGLRRQQSVTRAQLSPLEIDEAHGGIVKISPLADWSEEQVWAYAEKHALPIHRLHRMGYPSIGCAPCTRAVEAGEDLRAGRWWWENPEHKECGLHR
ncbi:adenosine-5'-phosphosulfate reductase, glutathione-dependent [Syntrophotalea carbinolica DSM 2380]|uniref:Adenosine 5'-phosphosulfate reductase n=1 Tax=Syntrophotalea carbinolica (strain DSM 2380 / NBRC 103641 / GraBd1) TaxID=338963 RepID=Q3A3P4_SYNC1|nr:phosphoadenylyl-sulfate reductase [Syntrophotalea carbinolica]ABA89013.1 adenosine-5'-phosphosulfate reductase, glutathione-dependent [Syntrophotalea carbinolica DSM 2380]